MRWPKRNKSPMISLSRRQAVVSFIVSRSCGSRWVLTTYFAGYSLLQEIKVFFERLVTLKLAKEGYPDTILIPLDTDWWNAFTGTD